MACYVSSGPLCLNIDMGKAAGLARVLYIIYKESKNKSHKDVSFAKFIFLILINVFANQSPFVSKRKYSLYIPFAIFVALFSIQTSHRLNASQSANIAHPCFRKAFALGKNDKSRLPIQANLCSSASFINFLKF